MDSQDQEPDLKTAPQITKIPDHTLSPLLNHNLKNAIRFLVAGIVIAISAFLIGALLFPHEDGGPAPLIGLVATAFFITSVVFFYKAKLIKEGAEVRTVTGDIKSTFQPNFDQSDVSLIRHALGVIAASVGGYIALLITIGLTSWGALVLGPPVVAVVGYVALSRINKKGLVESLATTLLSQWLLYIVVPFGFSSQFMVYVTAALLSIIFFSFHLILFTTVKKRIGEIYIIFVAIILSLVYVNAITGWRLDQSEKRRAQELQELNFEYYLPAYTPEGYQLEESRVGGAQDAQYVETGLDKTGGGSFKIYQYEQLRTFNPPLDCGPKYPSLASIGGATVCKEIATSKFGCKVYREITHQSDWNQTNERDKLLLGPAYCSNGTTTIVLDSDERRLSNEHVIKIFDSLKLAGGKKTPKKQTMQRIEKKDFITIFPVDPIYIKSISKFRSCVQPYQNGFNASDEPELERSLGHQITFPNQNSVNLQVFSPFEGVVEEIKQLENNMEQIRIVSPVSSWRIEFTYSYRTERIQEGSSIRANQQFAYINSRHTMYMSLSRDKDGKTQYSSIFSHMNISVLNKLKKINITPDKVAISKEERNANPCSANKIPDHLIL